LLQVKVVENHQNGKDTHVRGLKVYARDEKVGRAGLGILGAGEREEIGGDRANVLERSWLLEPEWMGDVELR
jgi:anaphase-promoting complex subunit 10